MAYSKYNTTRFQRDIPVKEGEIYDVEIEGVGEKGDGIGKVKGYVVIVPGTQKGDKVKVKVTAVRGRVSFGEVVGKGEAKGRGAAKKEADENSGTDEEDLGSDEDDDDEEDAEDSKESEGDLEE